MCDARLICDAYEMGWKHFICYGYKGQRFTGCGLSKDSDGVRIDVYGSSGDYLASGIDGLEIMSTAMPKTNWPRSSNAASW